MRKYIFNLLIYKIILHTCFGFRNIFENFGIRAVHTQPIR